MLSTAHLKFVRTGPRKFRRVLDAIRGKKAREAFEILNFAPYLAARDVQKLLKSAVYNAVNNGKTKSITEKEALDLKIVDAFADQGPTLKRSQPRSRGRAFPIMKRTSHVTLVLSDMN